jgi:aminomethyltransferase
LVIFFPRLDGPRAAEFLDTIVPTGVAKIAENTGSLTVFTNHAGGIIDDAIINITKDRRIRIVSNAGCADKVLAHVREQLSAFPGVTANVIGNETLIALQGRVAPQKKQGL